MKTCEKCGTEVEWKTIMGHYYWVAANGIHTHEDCLAVVHASGTALAAERDRLAARLAEVEWAHKMAAALIEDYVHILGIIADGEEPWPEKWARGRWFVEPLPRLNTWRACAILNGLVESDDAQKEWAKDVLAAISATDGKETK